MHDLRVRAVEGRQVELEGLQGGPLHSLQGQTAVNPQVLQARIHTLQVSPKAERLLQVCSGHLEDHVSKHQRRVENGYSRFLL